MEIKAFIKLFKLMCQIGGMEMVVLREGERDRIFTCVKKQS